MSRPNNVNCPKGLDPDYTHLRCRNCGRSIHFQRRSHKAVGHWQHNVDMSGIAWKRELRRRAG
jgi:hypothetical protein